MAIRKVSHTVLLIDTTKMRIEAYSNLHILYGSKICVSVCVCVCQAARVKIQGLENSVESFLARESQMKHMIRLLEQEKANYQKTIERMRNSLPADAADMEMTQLKMSSNSKTKAANK